jgi:hypothetical protein
LRQASHRHDYQQQRDTTRNDLKKSWLSHNSSQNSSDQHLSQTLLEKQV